MVALGQFAAFSRQADAQRKQLWLFRLGHGQIKGGAGASTIVIAWMSASFTSSFGSASAGRNRTGHLMCA